MTRTERSSFPRALEKDRHDSRTGLSSDPKHIQKGGAGSHSWGSLDRELDHEIGAFDDEPGIEPDEEVEGAIATRPEQLPPRKSSITITDEEREEARKLRAKALKDGKRLGPFYPALVIG
jgi:hypothetical protein